MICGLDHYRTDFTDRMGKVVARGWGCIAVEIPGTGDSPALKDDPTSPERQWSSLLDWVEEQEYFDRTKIAAHGLSTGGHYAMRIAYTHADRLIGVVAQAGGSHHMFDKEWIEAIPRLQYPYEYATLMFCFSHMEDRLTISSDFHSLDGALAYKFGYPDVEAFKENGQKKFSLLLNGIFDMPSTRLLLINVCVKKEEPVPERRG